MPPSCAPPTGQPATPTDRHRGMLLAACGSVAIIQALIAFVGRSFGKILSALFDWAVIAIFGYTSGTEKVFLSALLAAAGAWPVLLLGIIARR